MNGSQSRSDRLPTFDEAIAAWRADVPEVDLREGLVGSSASRVDGNRSLSTIAADRPRATPSIPTSRRHGSALAIVGTAAVALAAVTVGLWMPSGSEQSQVTQVVAEPVDEFVEQSQSDQLDPDPEAARRGVVSEFVRIPQQRRQLAEATERIGRRYVDIAQGASGLIADTALLLVADPEPEPMEAPMSSGWIGNWAREVGETFELFRYAVPSQDSAS